MPTTTRPARRRRGVVRATYLAGAAAWAIVALPTAVTWYQPLRYAAILSPLVLALGHLLAGVACHRRTSTAALVHWATAVIWCGLWLLAAGAWMDTPAWPIAAGAWGLVADEVVAYLGRRIDRAWPKAAP